MSILNLGEGKWRGRRSLQWLLDTSLTNGMRQRNRDGKGGEGGVCVPPSRGRTPLLKCKQKYCVVV